MKPWKAEEIAKEVEATKGAANSSHKGLGPVAGCLRLQQTEAENLTSNWLRQ